MFDIENSSHMDLYANEDEQNIATVERSSNEHLNGIIDALNDNVVTMDEQFEHEVATNSNLLYLNSNGSKVKVSENIKAVIKHMANEYKRVKTETFYKFLEQYYGIVESIDFELETFTAILTNFADKTKKILAEFDFDDLQYQSDRKLIDVGANFIWLIGKETQQTGQQTNMSKFVFRRTKALTSKQIEQAERDADEWTEFFKSIVVSDTSE